MKLSVALVTAALAVGTRACVTAHNYMQNRIVGGASDSMSMQVRVNGKVVCRGAQSVHGAHTGTEFCLANHDGKGSGCAPGYVYCSTMNGKEGKLEYYGESKPLT